MSQPVKPRARVNLDILQAIKRGLMRRGVMPTANQSSKPNKSAEKTEEKKDENPTPPDLTGSQEPQEVHEKLIDITEKAQDVLFKADTVWPFTLFPDTITLDREKLTVATRSFFRTAKIVSVPISSISSAEADLGPFFGSVHMASKYFVQNKYSVNFLSRSNAMMIEHMLQGFIIASEKDIDLTDIDKEDLLILLKDLGQGVSE